MGYEIVKLRTGALAVLDVKAGEVMHPIGPLLEARDLYVGQSRLAHRLANATSELVLFDVGLGAASNAAFAWKVSEAQPKNAPLHIISFENDLGALELALDHPDDFGLSGNIGIAARELLSKGFVETPKTRWTLQFGDVLSELPKRKQPANIIFWDMYSPRANPRYWTVSAFTQLRRVAAQDCTLFTYSASTSIRVAMLLAGWNVGLGASTGTKRDTTVAAGRLEDLVSPLDTKWLRKLRHPGAPFPEDAPENTADTVCALPQFLSPTPVHS